MLRVHMQYAGRQVMKVAVLVLVFGEWLRTREGKSMWELQMP